MKRLVFCFDGTWNRLDAVNPTNVVLTAQSIRPVSPEGIVQIIHYDPGVGTTKTDKWTGGLFGEGLLDKIVDAYTFLAFNYEIGDEVYVFGFSRGAFTARSFAGLLRNCGVVRRVDAAKITEVVKRYENRPQDEDHDSPALLRYRAKICPDLCVDQKEDDWRVLNVSGYVKGSSPIFRMRYLGVWDTVGSLGVPGHLLISSLIDSKYAFHDLDLSPMVVAARHAVAIDEERESFAPTLWKNFESLNAALGYAPMDRAAPYQQKWFPGVHGSVGGGGDVRGLSDYALQWVLDGAIAMGLKLDTDPNSRLFGLLPDHRAALQNSSAKDNSALGLLERALPTRHRQPGPNRFVDISESAIERWRELPENLPEGKVYRPAPLVPLANQLDQAPGTTQAAPFTGVPPQAVINAKVAAPAAVGTHHTVVRGETLRGIADAVYGNVTAVDAILKANRHIIDDPDRIYVGQVLFIPPPP